jgi:hypothetical protein
LNIGDESDIIVNPKEKEAGLLQKWYNQIKDRVENFKNLSNEGGEGGESGVNKFLTIAEIQEDSNENCISENTAMYYNMVGTVSHMFLSDRSVYLACPECNKKL